MSKAVPYVNQRQLLRPIQPFVLLCRRSFSSPLKEVIIVDSIVVLHHLPADLRRVDPGHEILHAAGDVESGIRHHLRPWRMQRKRSGRRSEQRRDEGKKGRETRWLGRIN